jgi:hypothetical protein
MRFAIGYRAFSTAVGHHIARALVAISQQVDFVGLGDARHPGWDAALPIDTQAPGPSARYDAYFWIDPAGRYFPRGIEDLDTLTACYIVDAHLGHWRAQAARFFDVVFLAQKRYVEAYKRQLGHDQVHWLPLAASDHAHRDRALPRIYDIGFAGNIDRAHQNTPRARRLALLRDKFAVNPTPSGLTPDEVGRVYSQSKLVFNTSIAGDATMRLFEGAACGAAVLTDPIAPENGAAELFADGDVFIYHDDAELLARAEQLLRDDALRARVARAGQQRVLNQHLYTHRATQILRTLQAPGVKRAAPMRTASPAERRAARLKVYTHLHMLDAVFDETRGLNPIVRLWKALPCLVRRAVM